MTYTYVLMDVPRIVYAAVRARLIEANYQHAFHRDGDQEVIDMHGLALRQEGPPSELGDLDTVTTHRNDAGPVTLAWILAELRLTAALARTMGPRGTVDEYLDMAAATIEANVCSRGLASPPVDGAVLPKDEAAALYAMTSHDSYGTHDAGILASKAVRRIGQWLEEQK